MNKKTKINPYDLTTHGGLKGIIKLGIK